MLHSIYDLTTFCRRTTGDVPAKLVGASTTVVGSKMYLFGGRLVTERKMVSDLYVFDLETFVWARVPIAPEDDVPRARYFHSADTWNNMLIIFGGMSNQPDSINPEELCVLNDVRFFDIQTGHWLPVGQASTPVSESLLPRARYAHLSSVTADRLFIIGGQDFNNTWLDDVCVYDLVARTWVQRRDYPRHCGTYRSVAVSSNISVRLPQEEVRTSQSASTLGPPGQRFGPDRGTGGTTEFTTSESLIHLPYSAPPSDDHPSDIYLYSNYNFTDVKRELEVFSPLPDTDFTIQDKSSAMAGTTFPPGLRFPTGAILGTNLIIAGTYLAHSYQSFSIWVLDLIAMTWSRIDPGKAVESGSWFRGSLWAEANKFIIFGNRNGNLVDDYNRRLLSWDHVAVVDLEAFGIYQPPALKLDITMQELGLAALEERVAADFDLVCEDGRRIACSRRILEERWPWFLEQRKKFDAQVKSALERLPDSAMHVPLPAIPGTTTTEDPPLDPRLTAREFDISEPYPIVLALLQYFYTTALVTPLQHAPAVLSQLLVIATNYGLTHLEALIKHAMHRALSNSTSVGVYEVATLCSCRSLQIRALKTVMSYTQKRPSRNRAENPRPPGAGGSGNSNGGGGPMNGGGGGSGGDTQSVSRPRGTSDARWRHLGESSMGNGYNTRAANLTHSKSVGDLRKASLNAESIVDPKALDLPSEIKRSPAQTHRHEASKSVTDAKTLPQPQELPTARDGVSSEDQISPLPVLGRSHSLGRKRSKSVVSTHTETEIHELADLLTQLEDTGSAKAQERPKEPTPAASATLGAHPAALNTNSNNPDPVFNTATNDAHPSVEIPLNGDASPIKNASSDTTPVIANASNSDTHSILSASNSDTYTSFVNASSDSAYARSNRYSTAPSVAPSLTYSMTTLASDHYSDGHEHISSFHRQRPPRIYTDTIQSSPPSLTSSTSYSSLSTGRFTSPVTPFTTSSELPSSDLAIIDERYASDPDHEDEEFNPQDLQDLDYDYEYEYDVKMRGHTGFLTYDRPVKQRSLQHSNIHWMHKPPPPPEERTAIGSRAFTPSVESLSNPNMSSGTPRSGLGRLLGRKKYDATPEKKEKNYKIKTLTETTEQRTERARLEALRDHLGVHPVVMGGMMALG